MNKALGRGWYLDTVTLDRNRTRLARGDDYSEQAYSASLQIKFAYAGRWWIPLPRPTPFTDRQRS